MTRAELPAINALVTLTVSGVSGAGAEQGVPSRVEDADGLHLRLAAPDHPPGVVPPGAGSIVTMRWTGPRGLHLTLTELISVSRDPIDTWLVRAVSEVRVQQRRLFARTSASGPVRLATEPRPDDAVHGRLIDIGEGGLRCRVKEGHGIAVGQEVAIRLSLLDRLLSLEGVVLVSEPDQIVLTFQATETLAHQIRRFVLHSQVRARRLPT
ncbi:MAG: hypothetical protein DLM59_19585 [Pseudonocardiales bacterium]|nr:MAG: hypothetical protein DLM59_19585 [Pseudonocardiales bacterium]